MKFSPYVTNLLRQKCKKDFCLSADCEYLALDIESVTGEHIGVNTLKRLLGFINDERDPRISTLDVIARYLGFDNWDVLSIYDNQSNSSFESSSEEIRVSELSEGQCVQISYLPDRRLVMAYQGDGRFLVQMSENSKLLAGDELTVTHIVQGYPLLVTEVVREGKSLGSFTAGKAQGIRFKMIWPMDTSSFSDIQQNYPDAELLPVGGGTCDCYRVRLYGKLHFLKRLKPELRTDPRYVSALQKEFETGYRLDHPHLVRYVSKGDDYLLTEYVDGETLTQFAASHPEYFKTRKNADRFLRQLLDVVGYLHQHQIVHLDLKPENILITRIGHEVKLTDLGYCYADTYTDTMGHTDKYAAPEQLNVSSIVDARTDIYAIGKILQNLPNSHIYNKVIARCTATDPSNRYQSIEELQSALKRTVPRMSLLLLMVVAIGLMTALFLFFQKPTKATTVIDDTLSEQPTDSASHSHKPDTVANFHKTVVTSSPEQTPIVPKQIPQQQSTLRELTDSEKAEIRRITLDILHPIYQRRVEPLVKSIIQGNFDDRKHSYSQISDTITKICIEADQEVYAGLRKVDINGMYPDVPKVDVNTVFLIAIGEAEHYYSQLALRHFYPKTKLPPDPFGK